MFKIAVLTAGILVSSLLAAVSPLQFSSAGALKASEVSLVEPPVVPLTERFEQAVNAWISELAKQPEFADWTGAKWHREPLGPGMHGWIVLLASAGKDIGYLVVSVDPNGKFVLSEYGTGEYPLFSTNTLYQSLVRQELIPSSVSYDAFLQDTGILRTPHYYSTLQNVWSITLEGDDYWLDGKTGEILPLDAEVINRLEHPPVLASGIPANGYDASSMAIASAVAWPEFDPYYDLSWLTKPQLKIKDLQKLQALLDQNMKLTFVAELYDRSVLYAFPVTGYQSWNSGGPFIRLAHNGARYVPAEALLQDGRFY